jgi:hypothetical protein
MAEVPHGMVNTELWSELSPERWIEHEYAIARTAGLPLIVSLGYSGEDGLTSRRGSGRSPTRSSCRPTTSARTRDR